MHNVTEIAWIEKIAASVMNRHSKYLDKWCYELGLILKAMEACYNLTGKEQYFTFIKDQIDRFVNEDGTIKGYDFYEFNLDHVNPGKVLLFLYNKTGHDKYRKASELLREQLRKQPRNRQGGFWHKGIYPHQMWLDGLYMSSPFYAEYAALFNEPESFADILNQITLMAEHCKDPATGLLYHAWDESRGMKWANDETGCSPNFWGRAMGWYMMALVDILDYLPEAYPERQKVIAILQSLVEAIRKVQDPESGVWYQVLDRSDAKGNYLEASASCMFTYAILKGVRKGYLNKTKLDTAEKAYEGIIEQFVDTDKQEYINLNQVCTVAGLGGNPYRDGSLAYYFSEPVAANDYKGYGPFLLASCEYVRLHGEGKD